MAYKYSKLGYGNAKDVEAAIALGQSELKLRANCESHLRSYPYPKMQCNPPVMYILL